MKWGIKEVIAAICVPLNVILILFGIIIDDWQVVGVAGCSIGLLVLPIVYKYYEQEEKQED